MKSFVYFFNLLVFLLFTNTYVISICCLKVVLLCFQGVQYMKNLAGTSLNWVVIIKMLALGALKTHTTKCALDLAVVAMIFLSYGVVNNHMSDAI